MEFRIADTFTESLNKLTNQEQKGVKTTAFDLQLNPENPGLRFHKLKTKDNHFWSVSANMDIRLIVHRTAGNLLLCYVDHHDDAYAWAEKRKIERHPKTGAAQLVEVRETVEEVAIRRPADLSSDSPSKQQKPSTQQTLLFDHLSKDNLLSYGIPPEWIDEVKAATETTLFDLSEHLPQEAAEALLELATGGTPAQPAAISSDSDPFSHPDAQRRFRVMTNREELQRALDYPWEKWTVFLHPAQQHLIEREYSGPARISGSAGTGKTIVALHRAVFLARRHPNANILLTTFSKTLANSLSIKLDRLVENEPNIRDRIQTLSIRQVARNLYKQAYGEPNLAKPDEVRSLLITLATQIAPGQFSDSFLWNEWKDIVDARQIQSWEAYKSVKRLGRKTRVGNRQRELLWTIFSKAIDTIREQKQITQDGLFQQAAAHLEKSETLPFDFAIVDEAQDIGIAAMQFLRVLGRRHPDSLFFTGDLGQRIFQQPYSWKSLGVDIRGRSQSLKINYRTSHQIRQQADLLLPKAISDVDGNQESRDNTISVFNGPMPKIEICDSQETEIQLMSEWITQQLAEGLQPEEIGVFVRSNAQKDRAIAAVDKATTATEDTPLEAITVSTMHLAKGLEFRAVAVMACDDEVIPLQERVETISDEADLEEVYNTERHLLYVACTRARDRLIISGVEPASEFLDDLAGDLAIE